MLGADGQYLYLHGREPERECACKMLGKDTDKALDGAEHDTVDHYRTVALIVCADVGEVKSLGQVHIKLDGTALPCSAEAIAYMEVDLRAVERAVAFIDDIGLAYLVKRALQSVGSKLPHFV